MLGITVAWDKGIYMRVSLFGLFLRCTSLMWPWLKHIQSLLLILSFTLDFRLHDDYAIPVLIYHTCALILYYRLSHLAVVIYCSYVLIPWICIFRFRSWIEVELSTVDRAFLVSWSSSSSSSCQTPRSSLTSSPFYLWAFVYILYIFLLDLLW